MEKNNRTNPSQAEPPHSKPQQGHQNAEPPQEGDIRKVEKPEEQVANDDAYEVEQDDFISDSESEPERDQNSAGNIQGDDVSKRTH